MHYCEMLQPVFAQCAFYYCEITIILFFFFHLMIRIKVFHAFLLAVLKWRVLVRLINLPFSADEVLRQLV